MSDLPSLEEPVAYVVVGPDDQRGPYTMELLIGEVLAGRLDDGTPIWWPGLADWTTIGGHPGLAAELHWRRSSAQAAAPGWADGATSIQAPEPVYEAPEPVYEAPEPVYEAPEPVYEAPEPVYEAPEPVYEAPEPAAPDAFVVEDGSETTPSWPESRPVEPLAATPFDTGSGPVIDVQATDGSDGHPGVHTFQREAFEDLVRRSSTRIGAVRSMPDVQRDFMRATVEAVTAQGFSELSRESSEGVNELRFRGQDDLQLVVTVGDFAGVGIEELEDTVLPLGVSLGPAPGSRAGGLGSHGDVVVVSDEWSGRSTAAVSLLLGLGDYVSSGLAVDHGAVARDIGATVSVVQERLG
jgi:hypothetical protein